VSRPGPQYPGERWQHQHESERDRSAKGPIVEPEPSQAQVQQTLGRDEAGREAHQVAEQEEQADAGVQGDGRGKGGDGGVPPAAPERSDPRAATAAMARATKEARTSRRLGSGAVIGGAGFADDSRRAPQSKSVIPSRSNRNQPLSFSKHLYKLRCRIQQIEGLQAYRNAI
jgi:hypothetical protein